jgi:hypothetical protein
MMRHDDQVRPAMHENRRRREPEPLDLQSEEFVARLQNAHDHIMKTNMVDMELVQGFVYDIFKRELTGFMLLEDRVDSLWSAGHMGHDSSNYERRYAFMLKRIVQGFCNMFRCVLGLPEPAPRDQVFLAMDKYIEKFDFLVPSHRYEQADRGPDDEDPGIALARLGHTADEKKACSSLSQSSSQTLEQRAARRLERMGYKPAQERQEAGAEY